MSVVIQEKIYRAEQFRKFQKQRRKWNYEKNIGSKLQHETLITSSKSTKHEQPMNSCEQPIR